MVGFHLNIGLTGNMAPLRRPEGPALGRKWADKPLVGGEEGEHIPQCLQPSTGGLVLQKLYRDHLRRLSLHSPNNLVSPEQKQDLSSMTDCMIRLLLVL